MRHLSALWGQGALELGLSSGLSVCLSSFSQGKTQRFSFADDYFSTLDVYVLLSLPPPNLNDLEQSRRRFFSGEVQSSSLALGRHAGSWGGRGGSGAGGDDALALR